MKRNICEFINEYLSQVEKENAFDMSLQEILDSTSNTWEKTRNALIEIRLNDEKAFDVLSRLDKDGILYNYLKFLKTYIEAKKKFNYTTEYISKKTKLQVLAIKRFENLHTIPKILNAINILNAVNLEFALPKS